MKNIMFCDSCGKPMHPSVADTEGKIIWKCNCGFTKESRSMLDTTEKIKNQQVGEGVVKPVIKKSGFPHKCKKCGYGKADVDILSAFYSDESDISLYRCQKCGYVERQTDGTSNAF